MTRTRTTSKKTIREKTLCEYRSALLAMVASNAEPRGELARHLEVCSACRTTLRSERELFSRIDGELRTQVSEYPRPEFLARLRVQLSRDVAVSAGSTPVWHVAGAALALVLLATFYPLMNWRQTSVRQSSVHGSPQRPTIHVQSGQVTQSARSSREFEMRPSHHFKHAAVQSAAPREPEVLVPPDEQIAFAQFVARVAGRDAMAGAVLTPASDKALVANTELPGVASVDLAALQLNGANQSELTGEWMAELIAERIAKTGESE